MSNANRSETLWTRKRIWELYGLILDDAPEHMSKFLEAFRYAKARLYKTKEDDIASIKTIIQQAHSEWERLGGADSLLQQVQKKSPTGANDWHLPPIDFTEFSSLTADMELALERELENLLCSKSLSLSDSQQIRTMQGETQKKVRQFIFEGELQEVLYRYRDLGESLPPSEQRLAAKRIAQGMKSIKEGMRALDQSILVEFSFTTQEWEKKWLVMEEMEDLIQKYSLAFGPDLGTISSKVDEGLERREFAMACGLVCLRNYGFAPKWAISRMLDLRSTGTGVCEIADLRPGKLRDTTEHWINGQLRIIRERASQLAKRHNWPTGLLIEHTSTEQRQRVVNTPPIEVFQDTCGKGASSLEGMNDWPTRG